jgi:hypothetical protein
MDNEVKQEKIKNQPHRFKKGETGNPHGRPKLAQTFAEVARKMMSAKKVDVEYTVIEDDGQEKIKHIKIETHEKNIYHGLVAALIKDGMRGNVNSITQLIDRTEGKALQTIEQKQDIHVRTKLDDVPDDDLDKMLKDIENRTSITSTGEGTEAL